ncbi:MAG TPA: hypothetical protein V6D28_05735 [Leptolyngbyaceae cyanobacterium]
MPKTLLVFLFSKTIDTYVNVIAYACDQLEVTRIKFVHVLGTKPALSKPDAKDISEKICCQIESLSKGNYIVDFETGSKNAIKLYSSLGSTTMSGVKKLNVYNQVYKQLRILPLEPEFLSYSNLRQDLQSILKKCGGSRECIVDITAASKVLSIDIFSICLALGVPSVFTFELKKPANKQHPEESLYHSLEPESYSYTHISESPPIKTSQSTLFRKEQLLWFVVAASLLLMTVSLYIYFSSGTQSMFLQVVNLLAAVIGIVAPLFSLFGKDS